MVRRGPGHPAVNALRLCLGTLTVLPVRPPSVVDRRAAGRAMLLAPVAAALLAVVAGPVVWALDHVTSSLLTSALAVGLLALLTGGLHLDGLADTADGLGSRRPAEQALEAMRRSDVGPFGVVTLLLVLLVQVSALASLGPVAAPSLGAALVVSRTVLPLLCLRGVPAARPDGLGALVAGTVGPLGAAGAVVAAAALAVLLVAASGGSTYGVGGLVVAVAALALGTAYGRHCVRRLGGVTGDVLGGCVEVTFTAALVFLAFL